MNARLLIKRVDKHLPLPEYSHEGDAGFDLMASAVVDKSSLLKNGVYKETFSLRKQYLVIKRGEIILVSAGIKLAVPECYELQVRPRSGLAVMGITVNNSPGTVDSGYRGMVCVILKNNGCVDFLIKHGDKIAQAVLKKVWKADFVEVDELPDSKRSVSGFGSTGR